MGHSEKAGSVWRRDRIVSITPQDDTSAPLSLSMMEASERPTLVSLLVEHKRLGVFKLKLRLPLPIDAVYKHSNRYLSCTQVRMHTTMGPQTVEKPQVTSTY